MGVEREREREREILLCFWCHLFACGFCGVLPISRVGREGQEVLGGRGWAKSASLFPLLFRKIKNCVLGILHLLLKEVGLEFFFGKMVLWVDYF